MASFRKRNGKWTYRYVDENGKQTERTGGKDLATTKAHARKAEDLVDKIKAGLAEPTSKKVLRDHLAEYVEGLRAKQRGQRHIDQCRLYATRMIELGDMEKVGDLTAPRVLHALERLKAEGKSSSTLNAHLTVIRSLAHHVDMPLRKLRGFRFNTEADRRRRRALSETEVDTLFRYLESAPRREQMEAKDRIFVYLVALYTGLRKGELNSLTPSSFRLEESPPLVVCEAAATKNGQVARQPLPTVLADVLRDYLATKPEGRPIWKVPQQSGRMIKTDLEAAGVDASEVDFHALRHTYCTRLALSGTPLPILKKLARHSKIDLTLNTYAHIGVADTAPAVESLRPYFHPYGARDKSVEVSADDGSETRRDRRKSNKSGEIGGVSREMSASVGNPSNPMLYHMPLPTSHA